MIIVAMLTIWRRHTDECLHRNKKGRDYLKCDCPLWADGYINGRRTLRQSLKTRDMAGREKAVLLESPEAGFSSRSRCGESFLEHCTSEG